ncbi:MAG: hypothetical protein HKN33_00390 [Pyrinomonadaceae bacterium]|nr:hypothetical protein [Pyrinomonadaceae bacterium]
MAIGFGCLCGKSEPKCEGFVRYQGEEFYGADKNAADAGRNACNNFCIAKDEKYDQYCREWKETPAAEKARLFRGGKLKRVDATQD